MAAMLKYAKEARERKSCNGEKKRKLKKQRWNKVEEGRALNAR